MIGWLITRVLVMVFGYAYPAYQCYKAVEKNKPDVEQLRFWCQYWILVAVLTVCERVGDASISWVPMYSEAKLALFVYLWYPKTMGTSYVYASFLRPYIASHQPQIDRNLSEFKIRAGDFIALNFHKASSFGQTRVFDILKFIAAQSSPPTPLQTQQPAVSPDTQTKPVAVASDASGNDGPKGEPSPAGPTLESECSPDTEKASPSMSLREAIAMEIQKDAQIMSESKELGSKEVELNESRRVGLRSRLVGIFR